jgi:RimJ/RimL family protein N-acetyltransferase
VREGRYQDCPDVRLTTILNYDTVVGYVMHSHIEYNEVRASQCGWCLHPEYWGQRIMTKALTQLLDDLILNENRTHVLANCFSGNRRCINLLYRLGFVRWRFGLTERVRSMITQQSLKWEHRFGLTPEAWNSASRENAV